MRKLTFTYHPHAGMDNLQFKLKTGEILHGGYGIITNNDPEKGEICRCARRWIADDGRIFGSVLVDEWMELD